MKSNSKAIPLSDYLAIKENPVQRNTAARAAHAKKRHLATWKEGHRWIWVAELPNGDRYLTDGHTRRLLIEQGHFTKNDLPNEFMAITEQAKDLDEVKELYKQHDSQDCVEQSSDRIYSAMKELGYCFKSDRFQTPSGLGAIQSACCDSTVKGYEWVGLWRDELIVLDNFNIPQGTGSAKSLTTGVIAACVMLIANDEVDNDNVRNFILALHGDSGRKDGSLRCGVQLLVEYLSTTNEAISGYKGYGNVVEKTLTCFDIYTKGSKRKKMPSWSKKLNKKYMIEKGRNSQKQSKLFKS